MKHFSFYEWIPGVTEHNVFIVAALVMTGAIVLISLAGRFALGSGETAIQPAGSFSLKGFFEVFLESILKLTKMVMGDGSERWVPLFSAIFFYIMMSNLSGLLPGINASTQDINTSLAIGLFTFFMYNFFGVSHGGPAYFKHFLGPVWWLAWLMLPLELVSHIVRPMSLGLRLSGNLNGDHTVLGVFTNLVPFGVPVVFYGLGLFVCIVQALVFTLLSMIYLKMATVTDHH